MLLDGQPRIMSHASGEGHSFAIRPVAMKPDEYKVVAERLYEIFSSAPKGKKEPPLARPAADLAGRWYVDIQYEVGSAQHKLYLITKENAVSGSHLGWAFQGEVKGFIDGDQVRMISSMPAGGTHLNYTFTGRVSGDTISGEVDLGEYGKARWTARRNASA